MGIGRKGSKSWMHKSFETLGVTRPYSSEVSGPSRVYLAMTQLLKIGALT